MANGVYVGSRAEEVALMLREIEAGGADRSARLAFPAADAARAEAVDAGHVAAGQVRIGAMTHRADRDAMEHERQSRLHRWQEQRDA